VHGLVEPWHCDENLRLIVGQVFFEGLDRGVDKRRTLSEACKETCKRGAYKRRARKACERGV
jgi:hypothetical protein